MNLESTLRNVLGFFLHFPANLQKEVWTNSLWTPSQECRVQNRKNRHENAQSPCRSSQQPHFEYRRKYCSSHLFDSMWETSLHSDQFVFFNFQCLSFAMKAAIFSRWHSTFEWTPCNLQFSLFKWRSVSEKDLNLFWNITSKISLSVLLFFVWHREIQQPCAVKAWSNIVDQHVAWWEPVHKSVNQQRVILSFHIFTGFA